MVFISNATERDFATIRDIAYQTWPVVYGEILSAEQLEYMLDKFYSEVALRDNMVHKNHHFLLAQEEEQCIGFASYQNDYLRHRTTHLHKIYVLPQAQGKGAGKLLLNKVIALAKENLSGVVSLNVNRFNKAFSFYEKMGFEIIAETDIELEHGYLMEDYIMEKKI